MIGTSPILADWPAACFYSSGRRKRASRAGVVCRPVLCRKGWVDDAAGGGFQPNRLKKVQPDVLRHSFRVSENVCHEGGLLKRLTQQRVVEARRVVSETD